MKSLTPLRFGDPTPQHIQTMRARMHRIPRSALAGITVSPPPSADSDQIRMELSQTREHTASPRFDPTFCEEVDMDMVPMICSIAGAHGVEVDPEELREIVSDLIPLIMRLKYHFNFPRPWQVSAAVGSPLIRWQSPSAETPSYPSGHAIQAGAACSYLAARNPRATRELDRAAAAVGLTRLQLGVHFPMDIVAGLRAGRQIGSKIP